MNLSCSAALTDGYPIKLLLLLRFPRKKSLFRQHVKELPICTPRHRAERTTARIMKPSRIPKTSIPGGGKRIRTDDPLRARQVL